MVMMDNQYKWMVYVGLEVLTLKNWSTRGSNSFAPTIGMAHWIAGRRNAPKGTRPGLALVRDGRPGLPGPLCNNYFGRRGEVVLVAAGRANHAGYGYWKGVTGNTGTMGTEAEAADQNDWTAEQKKYYVLVKIAELFCMWEKGLITWEQITSNRIVGHSEYALPKGRKIDINGFTMNQMRAQAAALIPGFKQRVNRKAIKVGTAPVFDRVAWKFVDGTNAPAPLKVAAGNSVSHRVKRTNQSSVPVMDGRGTTAKQIDTLHNAGYRVNVVSEHGSWTQIRNAKGKGGNAWVASKFLNPFYEDQRSRSGVASVTTTRRTNRDKVPVYAGTGSNAKVIDTLHKTGYRVNVTGYKGDTASWTRVRNSKGRGGNGWIKSDHLEN